MSAAPSPGRASCDGSPCSPSRPPSPFSSPAAVRATSPTPSVELDVTTPRPQTTGLGLDAPPSPPPVARSPSTRRSSRSRPKAITAKAGKLAITLDNKGKIQHELVVLKTSAAAAMR